MDLSLVVNLHREGAFVFPCLNSLKISLRQARACGIEAETIVVIDRPDEVTLHLADVALKSWEGPLKLVRLDAGDLAQARNAGIEVSGGEYIALADGDDLYSGNWLESAYRLASGSPSPEKTIVHPEAAFFFGSDHRIMWSPDSADLMANGVESLLWDNLWISTMLTSRKLLIDNPFLPRILGSFGFEDWSWYLAREADGVCHRKALSTVHCIRLKPENISLNKQSAVLDESPHPNGFLAELFQRYSSVSDDLDIKTSRKIRNDLIPKWRKPWLLLSSAQSPEGLEVLDKYGSWMPDWDEARYLEVHSDIALAIRNGKFSSGLSHYVLHGWRESRRAFMLNEVKSQFEAHLESSPELSTETYVPLWMSRTLDQLAFCEPLLASSQRRPPWLWNPFRQRGTARDLWGVAQELNGIDCVLLVPFLGLGGADLAASELARGLADLGHSVAVLATEGVISNARRTELANCNVRLIEVDLTPAGARAPRILNDLLETTNVQWIHVLNSELGWKALTKLGASNRFKLTVSLFCYDYDAAGRPLGYLSHFAEVAKIVNAVATDNSTIGPYLQETCGFENSRVVRLRHHVREGDRFQGPSASCKVLWAGRLDRQKNIPRLLAIAKELPELSFDVFGSSVTEGTSPNTKEWPDNVSYMGPFSDFSQIPRAYGAFLYTSSWDGLPNILLEVAKCGLPIIAPQVGGIGIDLPKKWMTIYSNNASPAHISRLVKRVFELSEHSVMNALSLREYVLAEHSNSTALSDIQDFAKMAHGS